MALPAYTDLIADPTFKELPADKQAQLTDRYWAGYEEENPDSGDYVAGQRELAGRFLSNRAERDSASPLKRRFIERDLADSAFMLRLNEGVARGVLDPETANAEIERYKGGVADRDAKLEKTASLFDPEVSEAMAPAFQALRDTALRGGVFGSPALDARVSDALPGGEKNVVKGSKEAYEALRKTISEDFHLSPDEVDDVIKHQLDLQPDAVSRDAFGTPYIKNEVLGQGEEATAEAIGKSNLPWPEKQKLLDGLPGKLAAFRSTTVEGVRKNAPDLARELGITEGDTDTAFNTLTAALNKTRGEQLAGGAAVGLIETMEQVGPPAIGRAVESVQRLLGVDESVIQEQRASSGADGPDLAKAYQSLNQLSNQFNQSRTEIFGTDAAAFGSGAVSVGKAVGLGYMTAGLGPFSAARLATMGTAGRALATGINSAVSVAPVAAMGAAESAMDTYDAARAAGKSDDEASNLAWKSGLIEFGVTTGMSAIGLGGAESVGGQLARATTRNAIREGAKKAFGSFGGKLLKGLAGEQLEEGLITALDSVMVQTKINPNMTVDDFTKALKDTAAVTLGVSIGPVAVGSFAESRTSPTYQRTTPELEVDANLRLADDVLPPTTPENNGTNTPESKPNLVPVPGGPGSQPELGIPGGTENEAVAPLQSAEATASIEGESPVAAGLIETLPPVGEEASISPSTDTTNETEIEGQRQGRPEVLTPEDDLTTGEVVPETPDAVGTTDVVPEAPAKEAAYSRDSLKEAFNLDDDQATAADALVQALGLDTSTIRVKKGGTPGTGLVEGDGISLKQGKKAKGSFEVLADGDTLIRGLTNADVSTALHEVGHVARRQLLTRGNEVPGITPQDIEVAEQWAGAKDGVWDRNAEEKFARGLESYLRDGTAPTPELAGIFNRIGEWLRSIYKSVKGTSLDVKISPEMRAVLDNLVSRKAPERAPAEKPAASTKTEAPKAKEAPAPDPDELTSTKNAATDRDLVKGGFAPIAGPARKALGTSWDEARAQVAADKNLGSSVIDDLNANPRAPKDDVEVAVTLHELADRKLEQAKAQDAYFKAVEAGDPETIREAEARLDRARGEVYSAITALKATGTAWGRSGRFRQLHVDRDYSLVAMEAEYRRVVNEGKPLTAEQQKEVKDLHDKIAELERKLDVAAAQATEALSRQTFDKTAKELKAAAKESRKRGEKAESFISAQAKAARERIAARKREGRLQANLDPADIVDHAIVGIEYLAQGAEKLAEFTARLVKDFGEAIRPHAEQIFGKSQELFDQAAPPPSKVKTREEILEGLKPGEKITGRTIYNLARSYINSGLSSFEQVMDAVLKDLQQTHPDLTLRELHDAYSGYGKTRFPSKEEDRAKLREYRALARLTSQLEDAEKGLAPMRTGLQRDKATERVRRLQKEVKATMRRLNIKPVSDEQRLATSLDAVKTRLRNEIEELDAAIKERRPRPEGSAGVEYDAEAKALKEQRDARKKDYDALFPKDQAVEDEKARVAAVKQLTKSIAELERRIKEGDIAPRRGSDPAGKFADVQALRATSKALQKTLAELRRAAQPKKTPEEARVARYMGAIKGRIKRLEEKLRTNDYSKPVKLDPPRNAEIEKLQAREIEVKKAYNEKLLEAELARRSKIAKVWDTVIDVSNAARSLVTSTDLSMVLRQGGFIAFGNPRRALRNIPAMFQAGLSEVKAKEIARGIEKDDNFVLANRAKLYLAEFGETHSLSKQEEAFRGRLIKKVPIARELVNFSERTYVTFLNKLRMDTFNAMIRSVSPTGNVTLEEAKTIANFINIATGRGNLGKNETAAATLAGVFFSPKYVASRFQLLAGLASGFRFGPGNTMRTRRAIATEYAKTLIGASLVYALGSLWDDEDKPIVTDPRSADFGKIRFGDTRVDPLFGLLQTTTFLSRIAPESLQQAAGLPKEDRERKFGDTLTRFLRTKLAPIPSAIWNLREGKNVVGEPTPPSKVATELVLPLSIRDIHKTMEEHGAAKGIPLTTLGLLGMGIQTYEPKAPSGSKPMRPKPAKPARPKPAKP